MQALGAGHGMGARSHHPAGSSTVTVAAGVAVAPRKVLRLRVQQDAVAARRRGAAEDPRV